MSETDDTDVLLLIPPNFFMVKSSESDDSLLESSRTVVHKPLSCTAQVLGKLVNQIHTLESRLVSLELSTDISSAGTVRRLKTSGTTDDSFDSHSLDRKFFTFPRRHKRKVNRKHRSRELSLNSLDSLTSYSRHVPPLTLKETGALSSKPVDVIHDIKSMDGDISSIVSTPNKKDDKLFLHEIDEFLTKVESYESPETKRNNQQGGIRPENVIKATGEYISNKLESKTDVNEIKLPSGRVVSSSILDKYIYLVRNSSSQIEKPLSSSDKGNDETNTNCSEPTKSLIDTSKQSSRTMRRLNFNEKDFQPTSTPKTLHTSYQDTFKPTTSKIYERASKVLEQYKSQNHHTQCSVTDTCTSPNKDFKMPQIRPYHPNNKDGTRLTSLQNKFIDSIDTDLLSLSDLWGEKGEKDKVDGVRLEEERVRREHCEAMIQQLQKKILEQQEKLAVAVKVDRSKDAAITKLREAWLRLTGNLDQAEERHRLALEKMMREVDNFKIVADDSQKKTSHFEAELYKALDLAHDYQEKYKHLTAEKNEALEKMEKSLENKQDIINSKDKEIEVLKQNYETVTHLNKQLTDCIKNLEDSLEKEKSDHDGTKEKSTEMLRKIQSATDEMFILVQERDLLKEKLNEERSRSNLTERQLCDMQNQHSELLMKCDNLDIEVKTLRKNLELQKTELKSHYQKQLEEAVLGKLQEFQQQLDHAEREMETDARTKEMAIVDTYNKQIARIEEQHKLEINVLEEKQREEIKLYRLQLAQASEKIGLLESKLESYRRRRGQIAAQLHAVMQAQWRQALRILTAPSAAATHRATPDSAVGEFVAPAMNGDYLAPARGGEHCAAKVPPLTLAPLGSRLSHERPLSDDKLLNLEGLSDTELQQYVKLLLTKPPNLDGSGDSAPAVPPEVFEEPTSDRPDKHERRDKTSKRSLNASKPPWKA